MDQRGGPAATAAAGRSAGSGFKSDQEGVGPERLVTIQFKAFPEQGGQFSIHGGGSCRMGSCFGEHNLTRYCRLFTPSCDEPFFMGGETGGAGRGAWRWWGARQWPG